MLPLPELQTVAEIVLPLTLQPDCARKEDLSQALQTVVLAFLTWV